jgi:hypothetical protein
MKQVQQGNMTLQKDTLMQVTYKFGDPPYEENRQEAYDGLSNLTN